MDFLRDIQPLLAVHCGECHGHEEQNGGLRFDDLNTAYVEADSGAQAIVAGQPELSELIKRVSSLEEFDQMPPAGERLTEQQIQLLVSWIAEGAAWPKDIAGDPATGLGVKHWSFQPITHPLPPTVADSMWARNPLDLFIQAELEAAGLKVVEDADAETLLRRVSFGLTGLPPTRTQVAEFRQAAASPAGLDAAFSQLTEQLLTSPSYGERWGRHWMDWVRYADTAGDNSDYPIPEAYLYRNYIIDALNEDVAYDRFLTEQLAGDLLPADSQQVRNRQAIATGYLAMARRFGSLVERYPWHLTIEDTIDNVGRTMLGLTLSCARCHDHKFDPISTRDYYGLYGIFASTRYPFPGLELFQAQRHFVPLLAESEVDATLEPHREQTQTLSAELEQLLAACEQRALENAAAERGATLVEQRKMRDELDAMLLKARRAGERLAEHLKALPEIPTAYAVSDAQPANARIQIKGEPDRLGAEVPRKFPDLLGGQTLAVERADEESGRLQLAQWIVRPDNPLTARVIVNRVWQRHFGQGLVSSTSDFGLRGASPTHPQLLDWLATDFMRHGWSLKHLHRTIISSRTYQLASRDLEENLASDPANRFHWKHNRQRLDAESLRDTLLMIGGSLDSVPQAEPHPFPSKTAWKFTQHHPFKDDYTSNKRSVYLMAKRLTAKPYFQTFDGPDPNVCTSDRDQSVTALQALYFVNDEFLYHQAAGFAQTLVRQNLPDSQRIVCAIETILGRKPSASESLVIAEYIENVRQHSAGGQFTEQEAWESLVRSLLRLNEFLYVD